MRRTSTAAGRPFVRCRLATPGHTLGPIALVWLEAAARLPGRSLHTAVALWVAVEATQSTVVQLSNVASSMLGVDRYTKYRSLAWLEGAGLITVQRKLGRSPTVTILVPEPPA